MDEITIYDKRLTKEENHMLGTQVNEVLEIFETEQEATDFIVEHRKIEREKVEHFWNEELKLYRAMLTYFDDEGKVKEKEEYIKENLMATIYIGNVSYCMFGTGRVARVNFY
ncbi:MAG: hypothetical protein ACK5ML_12020 [Lachnospiraceae bacterium]